MPRTPSEHADWLTKPQTAKILDCSFKTVEELTKKKRLRAAMRRNEHTNVKIRVYHPEDVDRERQERNPQSRVVSDEPSFDKAARQFEETQPIAGAAMPTLTTMEELAYQWISLMFQRLERIQNQGGRLTKKLYVTISEGAELTGLPADYLLRLVESGRLRAYKTPEWRIRWTDLENLDLPRDLP